MQYTYGDIHRKCKHKNMIDVCTGRIWTVILCINDQEKQTDGPLCLLPVVLASYKQRKITVIRSFLYLHCTNFGGYVANQAMMLGSKVQMKWTRVAEQVLVAQENTIVYTRKLRHMKKTLPSFHALSLIPCTLFPLPQICYFTCHCLKKGEFT